MRKIALLLVAVLMMIPAMAQVSFGVKVGGAYSSMSHKINDKNESGGRFGFSIGGLADIPLNYNKRLTLRPGVDFVHQGGSFLANGGDGDMSTKNEVKRYSLQVPVNVAYSFLFTDVRLTIFAGPVFDWSMTGKINGRHIRYGVSEGKDMKPCDLDVSFGVTVEFFKFFFTLNGMAGLIDRRAVKSEGETSVYQNNVMLSFGYFFRK